MRYNQIRDVDIWASERDQRHEREQRLIMRYLYLSLFTSALIERTGTLRQLALYGDEEVLQKTTFRNEN